MSFTAPKGAERIPSWFFVSFVVSCGLLCVLPIHEAQILTYMRLAKVKTGLLINFNVLKLKDEIKRYVL